MLGSYMIPLIPKPVKSKLIQTKSTSNKIQSNPENQARIRSQFMSKLIQNQPKSHTNPFEDNFKANLKPLQSQFNAYVRI